MKLFDVEVPIKEKQLKHHFVA